ncbi:hypothetical protein ACWOAH_09900 [Vagococcus vulneris]|uniref:HTH cro/C1-type domain-containing protein n=1 Tax=Vagococcus vulneris TaxID=1977869 RepID=A0A429ZWV2_9ENTE|nr:hypothetical protein [Vagococcus vulneris]RST98273.1 hypothetical protein CBF37_08145 [Vagococcus vulneris]
MIPKGERYIIDVVVDNMNRYMEQNNVSKKMLEVDVGSATIQNMLRKKTTNGCSIRSLQRIAQSLGVSTIDLVEDWEES